MMFVYCEKNFQNVVSQVTLFFQHIVSDRFDLRSQNSKTTIEEKILHCLISSVLLQDTITTTHQPSAT